MKIISLFNHKGGVSKTTTTFNLGWMLATQGHKTLIVDADPQCNLTALVLDYNDIEDIEDFYESNPKCDFYSGIEPVMSGGLSRIEAAMPIQTNNNNLSLLCGNLALASAETQISVALTTSSAIPAIKNIPGCSGYLLRKTAEEHDFDYVIIDMSPSVGALNQCLLMSSDYFIVPTSPDFFCAQAVKSLANVVPRWNQEINSFRADNILYSFPDKPPKFIGFISQRYRPRSGAPAKSFQRWIDIIRDTVASTLIPSLNSNNMGIDADIFMEYIAADMPFNLSNIADFNSLIAQSQKHNTPIFELSDQQIEQSGVILENMRESKESFKMVFSELASGIHDLTEHI